MRNVVRGSSVLLVLASILSTSVAQAMEIQKFDKMSDKDQDEYVAELILGAQRVLREEGHSDLAEQVHKLFTEKLGADKVSVGMVEFERNLARARVADFERNGKDPNATRLEVEHAMLVTLKKNDIILPKSFMSVMKDFEPKDPPKQSAKDTVPANAEKPPMITHNSDGTFTIHKEPSKEEAKNATAKKGLVIPPQVVIPIAPTPKKSN